MFPDGQEVLYSADNVILDHFTKEYIIEKKLFPYIPFYIVRYEKDLSGEKNPLQAVTDLEYFRDEMIRLFEAKELTSEELMDLIGFINTIITHITDGNRSEERLVNIMGGTVITTESERLISIGEARGEVRGEARGETRGLEKGIRSLVETCQEFGLSITETAQKLVSKFKLAENDSLEKTRQYWK